MREMERMIPVIVSVSKTHVQATAAPGGSWGMHEGETCRTSWSLKLQPSSSRRVVPFATAAGMMMKCAAVGLAEGGAEDLRGL